jgi:cytochrome c-type biogenesis protein
MIEGAFAYSFLLGVLAAVNPCGFALLPAYLASFLGVDRDDGRAPMHRALIVSASVSAGFLVVFLVVGVVSRFFTQWIVEQAMYAGLAIGVLLVCFGVALLAGWKPPLSLPTIGTHRDRSARAMFVFGVAYAVASIGCTIGLFTSVILGSVIRDGYVAGVLSIVLYGVGMSLLVTALTVTIAAARQWLLRTLRRGLPHVERVAAILVLSTGLYVTWYWWVAVSRRTSLGVVGEAVSSWQVGITNFLQGQGAPRIAVVLVVIVAAAIAAARYGARRETDQPEPERT